MGKFEDEQYKKLSQKMSNMNSDREHGKLINKIAERDMKNMERKR